MFVSFPLVRDVKWLMVSPSKIIATRPKPARKTTSRRGVGRAETLGRKDPAPSVRARYTTTVPGTGKPTPAPAQATEKIIVSNLPTDVNEAQIKVCSRLLMINSAFMLTRFSDRNCSIPPSDRSRMSPFIMIPLVARRESPISPSQEKGTEAKHTNNTTTASLMGVSIDHSFISVLYLSLRDVAPARSLSSFGYRQGGLKTKHRQVGRPAARR